MALVFISHAHSDKSLARRICALLGDALSLEPDHFFVSSEKGRGVTPAADIQTEVLTALATAPALIVLLTPKSALSPWVWLEAGTRLGKDKAANPLFVCPSERFTCLLGPFESRKALSLDNEGELVELVTAVAATLSRKPREYLDYKPALEDLISAAGAEYSVARERRAKAVSWLRQYAIVLIAAPLMLLAGVWSGGQSLEQARQAMETSEIQRNQDTAALAASYFVLTGTVLQDNSAAIPEAVVMASRDPRVREQAACVEPACTFWNTDSDGKFSIDLTKIRARKEETISLIVVKSGFTPNVKLIKVDVRAMDAALAPQSVRLSASSLAPGAPQ